MIKLNNKNITYVALADSNNSLKAPKEIWYAYSSNSVKLVYQRKDALIEGEDYEKYHWVKGDGSAYIDTLITSYSGIIKVAFKSTQSVNCAIFGRETSKSDFTDRLVLLRYYNNGYNVSDLYGIKTSGGYWIPTDLNDEEITIDLDNQVMTNKSGDSVQINVGVNVEGPSIILFGKRGSWGATPNGIAPSDVAIKKFSVSNQINFIPCKLLKPVPKWLDANGIRRQVGECGMIDLVSGKFYGNVNSVGRFTVENYYERKEWLQGRNGAYINTMHPLTAIDDAMRVHAHYDGVVRNPTGYEQAICGVVEDKNNNSKLWAYIYIGTDSTGNNAYQRGVYRYSSSGIQTDNINSLEFTASISNDGNNFTFTKNSVSITNNNPITRKTYGNVYLFNRNTMTEPELVSQRYFQGDIASFQIGNSTFSELSVDMIPCTLTMDLPASMDANNIARTKGTSGMWDLVSDKFYGNVASSGTFKAVNLAEGVDYEVHQWLIGDGTAYIVNKYNLWNNNVETRSAKINLQKTENNDLVYTDTNGLNWAIQQNPTLVPQLMVNFREVGVAVHILEVNPTPETFELKFYKKNGYAVCLFDGIEHQGGTMTESKWNKDISPRIYSYKMSYIREVLPNGSYRSNLVPCRLLCPIPAKYDANGIARQAGECGMYDTVNDKFYGNVASSGSFTVSDDN